MALTEQFKNECLRIVNDWKKLLNEKWGKVSHVDLSIHLDDNKERVLQDPFFKSFEKTRTLEELRWMAKTIIESRQDEKNGIGWYHLQLYKDKTSYASSVMFYVAFLEKRFLNVVSVRTNAAVEEEAKIKNELTNANNKITSLSNNQKPANYNEIKKLYDDFVGVYPNNTVQDVSEYTKKAQKELEDWNTTFKNKKPNEVKGELDTTNNKITSLTNEKANAEKSLEDLKNYWVKQLSFYFSTPNLTEKGIDAAAKNLKDYQDIERLWNNDKELKDKYGKEVSADNLKKVIADLATAQEAQKKAETDLKKVQDEKAEFTKLWKETVNRDDNWKPFGKEGIAEVGKMINDYNELLREARVEWENQGFTKYGARPSIESIKKLKADVDRITANQEKHIDYDQIKKDLKLANDKITDLNSQLTTANNSITDLTTSNKNKDKTISDLNHTIKDKDKVIDDDKELDNKIKNLNKQLDDKNTELKNRNNDIKLLTDEKTELGQKVVKGTQYLNKLLETYRQQITERTELFYQSLALDNNWVNEIYGDPNKDYLDRLKDLNGDSEPREIINTFRIVALIKATQKAQEKSDEYKERLATLPQRLKNLVLDNFNQIKEEWELTTDEPVEKNNPLYLPIVKEQEKYRKQIKDIITLWQ